MPILAYMIPSVHAGSAACQHAERTTAALRSYHDLTQIPALHRAQVCRVHDGKVDPARVSLPGRQAADLSAA